MSLFASPSFVFSSSSSSAFNSAAFPIMLSAGATRAFVTLVPFVDLCTFCQCDRTFGVFRASALSSSSFEFPGTSVAPVDGVVPVADATRSTIQTFRWWETGLVGFIVISTPACFTKFLVEGNLLLRDMFALTGSRHVGTFHDKQDAFGRVLLWLAGQGTRVSAGLCCVSRPRFQFAYL